MQCTVLDTFSSDGLNFTVDGSGYLFLSYFYRLKNRPGGGMGEPRVMQLVKRCWTVASKQPPPCSVPQQVF